MVLRLLHCALMCATMKASTRRINLDDNMFGSQTHNNTNQTLQTTTKNIINKYTVNQEITPS